VKESLPKGLDWKDLQRGPDYHGDRSGWERGTGDSECDISEILSGYMESGHGGEVCDGRE